MDAAFDLEDYTAEAHLPADSPLVGRTVAELEALGDGEVMVATIIRERFRRFCPTPGIGCCGPRTSSCSRGSPRRWSAWSRGRASARRRGAARRRERRRAARRRRGRGDRRLADPGPHAGPGRPPAAPPLHLLAISRSRQRITQSLESVRFRAGDVVVLKGEEASLPEALGELRVLPLAERDIALGGTRHGYVPALVAPGRDAARRLPRRRGGAPPSSAPPSCCSPCG